MTRLSDKFRDRRASARRSRAVSKALSRSGSATMRDELIAIAERGV